MIFKFFWLSLTSCGSVMFPAPFFSIQNIMDRSLYLIKEHARILKLVDRYDIFDPKTGEQIDIVKDEPSSFLKYLRLFMKKRSLPTTVNVYENEDAAPLFSIRKHMPIIRSKVQVIDRNGMPIGYFKSKILTIGGGFNVFDMQDNKIADIKGDWKGWNFKFLDPSGAEIGTVTKKWAGIGRFCCFLLSGRVFCTRHSSCACYVCCIRLAGIILQ